MKEKRWLGLVIMVAFIATVFIASFTQSQDSVTIPDYSQTFAEEITALKLELEALTIRVDSLEGLNK